MRLSATVDAMTGEDASALSANVRAVKFAPRRLYGSFSTPVSIGRALREAIFSSPRCHAYAKSAYFFSTFRTTSVSDRADRLVDPAVAIWDVLINDRRGAC